MPRLGPLIGLHDPIKPFRQPTNIVRYRKRAAGGNHRAAERCPVGISEGILVLHLINCAWRSLPGEAREAVRRRHTRDLRGLNGTAIRNYFNAAALGLIGCAGCELDQNGPRIVRSLFDFPRQGAELGSGCHEDIVEAITPE